MVILPRRFKPSSFTLVEVLTVMVIIAILASLVIFAGEAVMLAGSRNRAQSEIKAFSSALENYKNDNGTYPTDGTNLVGPPNSPYPTDPSVSGGNYQLSSAKLYLALSGKTNFTDEPVAGRVPYYVFKGNQVGNPTGASGGGASTYVQDPFNFSYGYSIGDGTTANVPYNGLGQFDLWSTGGTTGSSFSSNKNTTNSWICNWPN
ncbi:MAG TPA: prepilin-type N-terminal cleavage/methylation domain-containing protein [Candidatus Methylacidiphilales bacterium]|nr:prepilin-type N-terminal cleavage/methylation domain-containing protein [Candidatus Methylacidiphilales bacterium]